MILCFDISQFLFPSSRHKPHFSDHLPFLASTASFTEAMWRVQVIVQSEHPSRGTRHLDGRLPPRPQCRTFLPDSAYGLSSRVQRTKPFSPFPPDQHLSSGASNTSSIPLPHPNPYPIPSLTPPLTTHQSALQLNNSHPSFRHRRGLRPCVGVSRLGLLGVLSGVGVLLVRRSVNVSDAITLRPVFASLGCDPIRIGRGCVYGAPLLLCHQCSDSHRCRFWNILTLAFVVNDSPSI